MKFIKINAKNESVADSSFCCASFGMTNKSVNVYWNWSRVDLAPIPNYERIAFVISSEERNLIPIDVVIYAKDVIPCKTRRFQIIFGTNILQKGIPKTNFKNLSNENTEQTNFTCFISIIVNRVRRSR